MPHRKRIRLDVRTYRSEGQVVSITICTAGRIPVFSDVQFGLECVALLRDLSTRYRTKVLAYCLMPDHVHLLIESSGESSVIDLIRVWKSKSYHLRRRTGHKARLWQRSFHDHFLRNHEDVRALCDYIIENPVRAEMVEEARRYPLSGSFEFELW